MSPKETVSRLREELSSTTDPQERATILVDLGAAYRQSGESSYWFLKDVEKTIEAFGQSAIHYRESVVETRVNEPLTPDHDGWETVPVILQEGLAMAMCTHDEAIQHETATETLALPETFVETFPSQAHIYYYLKTYAATMVDHPDVMSYLDRTHEAIEAHDEAESVDQPGLWLALNGVLTDNVEWIHDGLAANVEKLVDEHDKRKDGVFCRGLGMAILARQHGYDVAPDSDVIPDELLTPPDIE